MRQEEELIKKMQQGDEEAMDGLVRLYYPEILRYCLWHAPDRAAAEDAAQETFLKAIRYCSRYVHKGKFRAFLYKIASNTCVDLQRKYRPDPLLPDSAGEGLVDGCDRFDRVISDVWLRQLIQKLPDGSQEIVYLRFAHGLTLSEIAQLTKLPLRTVQSRLRSSLKIIKKEWKEEG